MRSIILALLVPAVVAGQGSLQPGDKIRTISRPRTWERPQQGVVVTTVADSAVVRLAINPQAPVTLAFSKLEVARGQRRLGGPGALIGLLTGGVAGFAIGYAGGDDCTHDEWICFDRRSTGAIGAVGFGAIGTLVGAIVGHNVKVDRWVKLAPRR
jgi:hypothetical protein